MYEGWSFERWETPISNLKSAVMVSLVDDGCLKITIEDARNPARLRWRFTFKRAPIYRNILEEYRMELWQIMQSRGLRYGWTVKVPLSPWLARLSESEPMIRVHDKGLEHYQIGTEDDVIDILSSNPPLIETVEPAALDDPPSGKSQILYYEEDRPEAEAFLRIFRRGKDDA